MAWVKGIPRAIRDEPTSDLPDPSDQRLPRDYRYRAQDVWARYVEQSAFSSQCSRVMPAGLLFYLCCGMLIRLDPPLTPFRGSASAWIDWILLLVFCVPLFIWLLLSVADTIWIGRKYARFLGYPEPTRWPSTTLGSTGARLGLRIDRECQGPDMFESPTQAVEAARQQAIRETCVSHWLDIQVIAVWTRVIGPVIYYPFVVLCILILARNPLLDNWATPYPLLLVFVLSGLYAATSAFMLRSVAEQARRAAIDRFAQLLIETKGSAAFASLAAQIEAMMDRVRSLKEGAFAPFSEQPVVRAVLLPLLTIGGPPLLAYLGWSP